mmetsp:Transcript_77062/g.216310  ORF Transcript_77062/g.216310 Transcript_77062/m.216310 type:complete len:222 (-) Transcript_77062:111-776(-)
MSWRFRTLDVVDSTVSLNTTIPHWPSWTNSATCKCAWPASFAPNFSLIFKYITLLDSNCLFFSASRTGLIAISLSPHQFTHWSRCTLPSATSVYWCHTPIFLRSVFLSRTSGRRRLGRSALVDKRRPASARPYAAPADLQSARLGATVSRKTVERHGLRGCQLPSGPCLALLDGRQPQAADFALGLLHVRPLAIRSNFCTAVHHCMPTARTSVLQHTAANM